jgi:hypothetical protein
LRGLRAPSRSFALAAGFGFRRDGMDGLASMTSGPRNWISEAKRSRLN